MSVRRPFSPPLHSAAHYTRKHLQAGQRAAPPNHAEWADAKRVRSISTVRSVRFEPLADLRFVHVVNPRITVLGCTQRAVCICRNRNHEGSQASSDGARPGRPHSAAGTEDCPLAASSTVREKSHGKLV